MNFCANFEIDIIHALTSQLIKSFARLTPADLVLDNIDQLPTDQGVYQLFHCDALVYIGKAKNLRKRLSDHDRKITGRRGISSLEVKFKCLSIHRNWTPLAPEDALIKLYRASGDGECEWNGSGFGIHDPGRRREETDKSPDGFDAMYPIRDDWICDWIEPGARNGRDLLMEMKTGLPYLLRYQTANPQGWRNGHPDYNELTVHVREANMTARELLRTIAANLPKWQATIFPSHMILYKESRQYEHGEVLAS